MSDAGARAKIGVVPRRQSDRRDRVVLSVPRSFVGGAVALSVLLVAGAFGAGYRLGAGARIEDDAPPSVAPTKSEVPLLGTAASDAKDVASMPSTPVPREPPRVEEPSRPLRPEAAGVERNLDEPPLTYSHDPPAGRFGFQLGAYPSEAEALALLAAHRGALSERKVFVVPTRIPGKGTWYRVRVDVYDRKSDADAARSTLPENLESGAIVVEYR